MYASELTKACQWEVRALAREPLSTAPTLRSTVENLWGASCNDPKRSLQPIQTKHSSPKFNEGAFVSFTKHSVEKTRPTRMKEWLRDTTIWKPSNRHKGVAQRYNDIKPSNEDEGVAERKQQYENPPTRMKVWLRDTTI
jgi:hypothetical protein